MKISVKFTDIFFCILKFIFLIKLLWVQWEGYFAEYVEYLWINVI